MANQSHPYLRIVPAVVDVDQDGPTLKIPVADPRDWAAVPARRPEIPPPPRLPSGLDDSAEARFQRGSAILSGVAIVFVVLAVGFWISLLSVGP